MATKFRSRALEVEAFKWMEDVVPEWWTKKEDIQLDVSRGIAFIPSAGTMKYAHPGDYIFLWSDGEIKTSDPATFEALFELAGE